MTIHQHISCDGAVAMTDGNTLLEAVERRVDRAEQDVADLTRAIGLALLELRGARQAAHALILLIDAAAASGPPGELHDQQRVHALRAPRS